MQSCLIIFQLAKQWTLKYIVLYLIDNEQFNYIKCVNFGKLV